jgi:ketosteroid isomerase-like protein
MSPEIVARAVQSYFATIKTMDAEQWIANFAEDAEAYDPADAPPHTGHDGLRQFFGAIAGGFKEVALKPDHIFIVGHEAAVKWTGRGVGKNGKSVHFEGIDVFEINEAGKIQKTRAYWNPAELMGQLESK